MCRNKMLSSDWPGVTTLISSHVRLWALCCSKRTFRPMGRGPTAGVSFVFLLLSLLSGLLPTQHLVSI